MEQERIRVLLIGDCEHREFAEPRQQLARQTVLHEVATVSEALAWLRPRSVTPQAVVFAQLRPGQFRQADIERVHQAVPLARLVALLGSWCEGESRSGQPWTGVIRIYWHQWSGRWREQQSAILARLPIEWELPRTAAPVEQTLAMLRQVPNGRRATIGIATARPSFYEALVGACRAGGLQAVPLSPKPPHPQQPLDAVLWEPCAMRGIGWDQLHQLVATLADVPIVALLNFPRQHDVLQAERLGAAAVVSCPFQLPDLWSTLKRVVVETPQIAAADP